MSSLRLVACFFFLVMELDMDQSELILVTNVWLSKIKGKERNKRNTKKKYEENQAFMTSPQILVVTSRCKR